MSNSTDDTFSVKIGYHSTFISQNWFYRHIYVHLSACVEPDTSLIAYMYIYYYLSETFFSLTYSTKTLTNVSIMKSKLAYIISKIMSKLIIMFLTLSIND